MRATLIHNPTAGARDTSRQQLIEMLLAAGIEPVYQSSKVGELTAALHEPADVVIAAGGDGTVAKVLTQLPNRSVPVAIFPLGTANNIASSFGIGGSLAELAAGLHDAERRRLDIVHTKGPWGCCWIVEGVGVGALVRVAQQMEDDPASGEERLDVARRALRKLLEKVEADRVEVLVDGEPLPSEHLMVEVLNIACGGPRLFLAPDVDPGDGKLDVIVLEPDQRDAMRDWLDRGDPRGRPPLTRRRGEKVKILWDGTPLHVDDDIPSDHVGVGVVEVRLADEPTTILVPAADGPPGVVK